MNFENEAWTNILAEVVKTVKRDKVSITVKICPDYSELEITPWESYQPRCPYADRRSAEEDDGK